MIFAAIIAGALSLIVAAFTLYVTQGPIRRDLDACLRERAWLRTNLQLVQGAIVGMLPERERFALLRQLEPPPNSFDEDAA
jgi:hypothetical protein